MRQRLGREEFHPALRDAPRFAESVRQQILLPLRTVAVHQPFLAVDHVLGTAVALLRQQRRQHAALRRHRIDGVLHHRQLARGHRAHRAMPRSRNSDGMLNLLPAQMQRAPRHDRRDKRRQRRVMPAALADPGKRRLAQTHFELVAQHESNDQFLAIALRRAHSTPSRPGKYPMDATDPASSKCRCNPCSGSSVHSPATPKPHRSSCPCRSRSPARARQSLSALRAR